MNVPLRRAPHDGRPTVVRFRAMLKEDGTRQEIIAQQAVTMRQLTAAASQEASEDADTVEEAPDRVEPPRSAAGGSQEPVWRRLRRRVFGG
jgi:hypothetical protein